MRWNAIGFVQQLSSPLHEIHLVKSVPNKALCIHIHFGWGRFSQCGFHLRYSIDDVTLDATPAAAGLPQLHQSSVHLSSLDVALVERLQAFG